MQKENSKDWNNIGKNTRRRKGRKKRKDERKQEDEIRKKERTSEEVAYLIY